jgi:hypothetical protein
MKARRILLIVTVIVLIIMVFDLDASAQCAMCKKNLESNLQTGGSVGTNINKGILYLMAIPYLLIATLGFVFFRKQISEKLSSFRRKS